MHRALQIRTHGPGFHEITRQVAEAVQSVRSDGVLTLFVRHSSASLLIQENADPEVQTDLLAYLERLVPRSDQPEMSYLTHTYEGPDDMPGHIKAALLPVSLQVPVSEGRMLLGRWQGIYLVEHRDAPHTREITLSLPSDTFC